MRANCRNDSEEPRIAKSRSDTLDPILLNPQIDIAEPTRPKLLNDMELPMLAKSIIESADPRRK